MFHKAPLLISLLIYWTANVASGVEFRWPEEYSGMDTMPERVSRSIVEYCHFDESYPIDVIVDSQDLVAKLNRYLKTGIYQYLLINDDYRIEQKQVIAHDAILCGLHDWLVDTGFGLNRFYQQILNGTVIADDSGSSLSGNCSYVSIVSEMIDNFQACRQLPLLKKTTLFITDTDDEQDWPLLASLYRFDMHHLNLRINGARRSRGPLLSLGNNQQYMDFHDGLPDSFLSDINMEDYSGEADSLLQVYVMTKLQAENITLNFSQQPDGSSKALHLLWTGAVRFNGAKINCYGNNGTAVYWDGTYYPSKEKETLPFYLRNLAITAPDNATMTGMYLNNQRGNYYFYPIELSNITLSGGFESGFTFADDLPLAISSNCGTPSIDNHWQSTHPNASRCTGNPTRGMLLFDDHVACVPED